MKRFFLALWLLAALGTLNACTNHTPAFRFLPMPPGTTQLTAQQSGEDANELIDLLESNHPAFFRNEVPALYAERKAAFLEAVRQGCTVSEFQFEVQKFLIGLKDGHTGTLMSGYTDYLDVRWFYDCGALQLLDESGAPTGRTVVRIGDVPIETVFGQIDTCFVMENEAARAAAYTNHAKSSQILSQCGIPESGSVTITIQNGEEAETMLCSYGTAQTPTTSAASTEWQWMGDVFYIRMVTCTMDDALKRTAQSLAKAVEAGTSHVIIDVRDNGGGNSAACDELLYAMGMNPPAYGGYIPASEYALQTKFGKSDAASLQRIIDDGYYYRAPSLAGAKRNDAVSLAVLTNEGTYSSATMLAVYVQDGKLGTVIGRPSANSPNSYGDIWYFQLSHSRVAGTISLKYILRPDMAANGEILMPDIPTALGEDALAVAMRHFGQSGS